MSQEIAISCIVCTWCGKTFTATPVSDKAELIKQIHEHESSCGNNPLVKRIAELEDLVRRLANLEPFLRTRLDQVRELQKKARELINNEKGE